MCNLESMRARLEVVKTPASAVCCAALLVVVVGCASAETHYPRAMPSSEPTHHSPTHGSLTNHQFRVARDIARSEADRLANSITSATATFTRGRESRHNVGVPCRSSTLLHITLIGTFRTSHGGAPG